MYNFWNKYNSKNKMLRTETKKVIYKICINKFTQNYKTKIFNNFDKNTMFLSS